MGGFPVLELGRSIVRVDSRSGRTFSMKPDAFMTEESQRQIKNMERIGFRFALPACQLRGRRPFQ